MAWSDLGTAMALLLVIEGLLPFLSPQMFKDSMKRIDELPDQVLRMVGLGSMLVGLVLLYLVR